MEQDAHLARFARFAAIPLALLAQGAGTTPTDTGPLHHAQAAIGFSALFLNTKLLIGWTMECPIRLDGEIAA